MPTATGFSVWLQWKSLCPLSLSTSEMRKVKGESSRPWADWKTAARFGLPWISVLTWKMVRRSHLPTWSAVPPPDCLNQPSTAQYTSLSAATSAYAAAVLLWVLLPPPPPVLFLPSIPCFLFEFSFALFPFFDSWRPAMEQENEGGRLSRITSERHTRCNYSMVFSHVSKLAVIRGRSISLWRFAR
ncbi:uncharacterized protein LOC120685485 isoform X4 [Panicum virgatum]|uniref:uncharacterized protein LOC120685485 isoform X4 n=1 Tax=Panicum virgatum TaxID=38727 RepID=UPI0019D5F366|nr:uncharacterized protein LOC120685485 isoform X4 [Panicum virgatum]